MARNLVVLLAAVIGLVLLPAAGDGAASTTSFSPGSPGIGDPYFPLDGNGGYDVAHYDLAITYQPDTDRLAGTATIKATATHGLSRFNLDLKGLTVRSVTVAGTRARWAREGDELVVTPSRGIPAGTRFTSVVVYDGIPVPNPGAADGFVATDDGAVVMGEPHVAATWYPVNDHPSDKALYDFHITVPSGLQAVANGALVGSNTSGATTTWHWRTAETLASYLTTATMGQFDLHSYTVKGISYVDAVDPDLDKSTPFPEPTPTLMKAAIADQSYQRLTRTIPVPAGGATLSFQVIRGTELNWDYVFVEAHTPGGDDWTTLTEADGRTTDGVGLSCPSWHEFHPFLTHYQTANPDGSCSAKGSTGSWSAATGTVVGPEEWAFDLRAYAGREVEVSITYASDEFVQGTGVFIDDIVLSNDAGSTSFEDDGDQRDDWVAAHPGDTANTSTWALGSPADLPVPGIVVRAAFERQPKILDFLAKKFGPYPFTSAGGIVDDHLGLDSSLETQTRPIYAVEHFSNAEAADIDIVHELAHQWFGDSVTIGRWQDIWLNEGFATYAEWLWTDKQHQGSVQDSADEVCATPADDPFWALEIGDPGPDRLFDDAVYERGALTLQQLHLKMGDKKFFQLLQSWASSHANGVATTPDFIDLASRIHGQPLNDFFTAWLYTDSKPGPTWRSGAC